MKVQIDLDPRDVWRIQARAEAEGRSPGAVLREELAQKRSVLERRQRVRAMVLAGMCDAEIAAELGMTNGNVATIRRGERLPANRRYGRKTA